MAKLKRSTDEAAIQAYSTRLPASLSSPCAKGDAFVSDIDVPAAPFLALCDRGQVTDEDISDFIEALHESGDDEQRMLPEYLGMTAVEYEVWLMDHRMLRLVVMARRGGTSLCALVGDYYDYVKLCEANRWEDRAAIPVLSYWLAEHPTH
jgi:hypothetical protein